MASHTAGKCSVGRKGLPTPLSPSPLSLDTTLSGEYPGVSIEEALWAIARREANWKNPLGEVTEINWTNIDDYIDYITEETKKFTDTTAPSTEANVRFTISGIIAARARVHNIKAEVGRRVARMKKEWIKAQDNPEALDNLHKRIIYKYSQIVIGILTLPNGQLTIAFYDDNTGDGRWEVDGERGSWMCNNSDFRPDGLQPGALCLGGRVFEWDDRQRGVEQVNTDLQASYVVLWYRGCFPRVLPKE